MTVLKIRLKKHLLIYMIVTGLLPAPAFAGNPDPEPVAPAQPVVPARTFNLSDFGAIPDGHTFNTDAFRRAIAAVKAAGGGTLVVTAGDYLTGPFNLCSRINLHLERGAHILFSNRFGDYPVKNDKRPPLLGATNCEDIIISGEGVIDGQGKVWWDVVKKELSELHGKPWTGGDLHRPWMIVLRNCQRIRVEGVQIRNSPMFQCTFVHCEDITVKRVKIYGPEESYNTDGIDPINCKRVLISHCDINTGDDCIALKASHNKGSGGTSEVLVTDCSFHNGHGVSLGSGVGPFIRNVLVRRCTFDSTNIGIRYKSSRTRGGLVENITFTNLKMQNVDRVIDVTSFYPPRTRPRQGEHVEPAPVTPKTPIVHDIVIRNLMAKDCGVAGFIIGLPEMPLENITLENVTIDAHEGLRIAYTKDIMLHNVTVHAASGEPYMIEDSVTDLQREPPTH